MESHTQLTTSAQVEPESPSTTEETNTISVPPVLSLDDILAKLQLAKPHELDHERIATALRAISW